MNGFTLLLLIALFIGVPLAFRAGMLRERRDARMRGAKANGFGRAVPTGAASVASAATSSPGVPAEPSATVAATDEAANVAAPLAGLDAHAAPVAAAIETADGVQLRAFADDRARLFRALADARGEAARYREIVVDLEEQSPPPLLDLPNAPDDLKLIVGIGPVLERMLQRLGIATYRQIARWSEHEIDVIDARLPEFRGRIRRDAWVTQARSLHQSKYGEKA